MDDVLKDLGDLTPEEQELLRRKLQKLRKKKAKPPAGAREIPHLPRQGQSFPLSFAQQRLWFLDQLRPEAAANNIPLTVELVGDLQPSAFEGALQAVVERHEILRAAVDSQGGRPSQRFDAPPPPMAFLDLSGQPPEERRRRVVELARSHALEPFDLSAGPLLRTVLVREAADRHVFVFTIHHLIFDRWSVGLLLGELGAEYQARLETGEAVVSPLEPLPVQYGDFAAWEQERLTGELLEQRMDFWRRTLDGYDPRLGLPTDRPRPAVPASRGGTHAFSLDAATAEALNRLSVDEGASLFMTLLAAFHGVLARLAVDATSGVDREADLGADIGIGLSVSNRGQRPLERLVGCFTNHLVVRARLEEQGTLRQLLATVREATLGALAHQDLPAEKVVEVLREQAEDTGRGEAGLFQVLFRLNNQPLRDLKLPGLDLDFLQVLPDKAPFDLDLSMEERDSALGGGLEGLLVYSTDLFEPATAEAIAELYRAALMALAADPDQPLATLEIPRRLLDLREVQRQREEAPEEGSRKIPDEASGEAPELPVAVAATFTADLVGEPLELWLEEAGWKPRIELAPYNQVFQQLLDPTSALATNRQGVNLVLLRLADWVHYRGEAEALPSRDELQERVDELLAALANAVGANAVGANAVGASAAQKSPIPWLVAVCPSPDPADQPGFWRALDARLAQGLKALDGVYPVTAGEVAELYPVPRIHDPFTDEVGHVPFTPEYFTALGTLLARRVVALRRPPFKVVAVDCDNTLWDGACAEVGADGVGLGPARRRLQDFLVQQRDAGMLVALVSKNADADVVEVFRRRQEMPLSLDHVVARKISWEPKSQALGELAEELGFGLDRFVFLDDNPVECAEVRASCPAVTVLPLPEPEGPELGEASMQTFLAHAWPFDRFQVTEEDRRRAGFYQANQQREELRRSAPSLEEFLAGLELEVEQRPLSAEDVPRVSQMTQRVTQFNATTRVLSEAEVTTFLDAPGDGGCRVVRVRDRFGDYGLVGCSLYRLGETALEVENLLMSCRTLGRGVEHRLVAELGRVAQHHGLEAVEIPFRPTHRNAPMARFLEQASTQVPGADKSEEGDGFRLRLPAAEAAAWQLRPETPPEVPPPEPAAAGTAKVSTEGAGAAAGPPPAFYQRALELCDVDAIAREILQRRGSGDAAGAREKVPYVAPRNPIEEQVAQIWCDVLGLEKIGVHEHFFRIGGHSLLGTVILSRIQLDFDVDLPLMAIFDNPTVEGIGRVIEELLIGDVDEADLAGLEGLSEEEVQALLEEEQAALRGSGS
ncbi:MAG: HAD-IIIC family phosphatase [Acidobacteriota bacterium]|nr:HAD-IIIC family phosphatase [Acidobacteriota bacterium]